MFYDSDDDSDDSTVGGQFLQYFFGDGIGYDSSDSDEYSDSDTDDDHLHNTVFWNNFMHAGMALRPGIVRQSQQELDDSLKRLREQYPTYLELTVPELTKMTVATLKNLCKAFNVKLTGRTKKADIVGAFVEFQVKMRAEEQAKKEMDGYHRGTVQYSLPPYTIIKILTYCWRLQVPSEPAEERFAFRRQLSLMLISKEFYKYVSTLFTQLDLCYAHVYNAYTDNKCKLYQHLKHPFSSIKNIVKLRIIDKDFGQVLDAAGPDYKQVFANLTSLTLAKGPGSTYLMPKVANLPSLTSFTAIRMSPHSCNDLISIKKLKIFGVHCTPSDLRNTNLTSLKLRNLSESSGLTDSLKKFKDLRVLGFDNNSTRLEMFIQHLVEENGHQVQKTTTLLELFKQYLLHADTKLEVLCITRWNNYTALGESKTLHTIELTGEFSGHLKECIAKLTAVFEQITPLVNIKTLIISITDPTLFTNDLDLDIPYIKKHAIKELIPGSNNKTIERSYSLTDPLPFKSGDYGFALGQIKFISRPLFNETRCFKCYFHR